ncbi:MAG: CocE/NonD family hydrolase [Phycisphaerae bacterium]|nr:CocE/NonD family hydrolase [Phycisphaerae bacterium]
MRRCVHQSLACLPTLLVALTCLTFGAGCASSGAERTIQTGEPDAATGITSAEADDTEYFKTHYEKKEFRLPVRDGVELFTQVYSPRDTSKSYPILMIRTPYSCNPYGESEYSPRIAPHMDYVREGYIFVRQDVRGCFMSGGDFVDMRPHVEEKKSPTDVDESSDTYDTIDWLVSNIPNNNGRVGIWGISYPGFYAAAGMIDAHPALKAVSPQAPIADWYFDDFHHHGAFFLPHAFGFMSSFCKPRKGLTTQWQDGIDYGTPDGYQFFLDLGPLKNANEHYFHDELPCWNDIITHPDYDQYWQSRNILPHLKNVAPAVLIVGGWFDAEDLYGPLKIYRTVKRENPGVVNSIVMGPWPHGGWSRTEGNQLGNIHFGGDHSEFYRREIELPFFRHHLKQVPDPKLPEAFVFETGANIWRRFDAWPPAHVQTAVLYAAPDGSLAWHAPETKLDDRTMPSDRETAAPLFDEFVSDPAKPVPFSEEITTRMTRSYMTDDQRFAARRPDVLVYQTDLLEDAVTIAGPILADLWVSTSGTDSDWVVKLIDVFPPDAEDTPVNSRTRPMGGYQMMVRSEVIRGRYRNNLSTPEPFTPDEPTNIRLELLDILHTFEPGHRIMIQIQCTWFPLIDRNPQKFVENIYMADETDFIKATQRVYRSTEFPTRFEFGLLPSE